MPGLHWLAVLVVGLSSRQGPPKLALMRWWSSRGPHASFKRDEEGKLLIDWLRQWGSKVIHVFDQGFASAFWLGLLLCFQLRFVLRWKRKYHLVDANGNQRATWRIAQGKRGWEERTVWDSRRARWVRASVLALPVRHPDFPDQRLWLVVCRWSGRLPWYLLTAEPIETTEDAWRVMRAYARSFQIEQTWRYDKSELAFQSPRVWAWETRLKLLALATLAYAFLLQVLRACFDPLRVWLLRTYCHRTGWHLRRVKAPLYRLRMAISRLWQEHPPDWFALARPASAKAVSRVIVVEELRTGLLLVPVS